MLLGAERLVGNTLIARAGAVFTTLAVAALTRAAGVATAEADTAAVATAASNRLAKFSLFIENLHFKKIIMAMLTELVNKYTLFVVLFQLNVELVEYNFPARHHS